MDREELLQLLREAQEAIRQGAKYNDVNQRIRELTGGQFAGLMSLTIAVDPQVEADAAIQEDLERVSADTPLSNFVRTLAEGATFGFADELAGVGAALVPGGQDFEGAVEESRARMDVIRRTNPGAAFAGELAGVAASPLTGLLGAGFGVIRGAGGVLRSLAAGGATGAAGGALMAAGQGEGDLVERAAPAAVGGLAGGLTGGLLSAGGAVAGRFARPFRSTRRMARDELADMTAQAGLTPEELPAAVRRASVPNGPEAVVADVSPAFGRRAPGIVRQAPGLQTDVVPALRVRLAPQQVERAKRAVWEPLERANPVVRDRTLINLVRSDPAVADAARRVMGQKFQTVDQLTFRQAQSIRQRMVRALTRDPSPEEFRKISDALTRFDALLETRIPGFREANQRYREVIQRLEGFEALQKALDRAFPAFRPDLPNTLEGITATAKNALLDIPRRREAVAEMVGELILTPGGAEKIRELLRQGFFARAFAPLHSRTRQTGLTEIGRLFGGTVQPEPRPAPPGLLGGGN